MAMRWTGADVTQELAAFHRINRAQNLEQFTQATRLGGVPALSFVYADRAGRVAAMSSARVPVCAAPSRTLPIPGWDSRFNWKGAQPMDRLPRLVDPPRGFVLSANNRLANGLPFYVTDFWEDPSRAQRLEELLLEGTNFAPADFAQMQADVVSPHMREMVGYLLSALPDSARQRPLVRKAIARLRGWNGSMVAKSPEAAVAAVWFQWLIELTYRDELGPVLFPHYVQFAQNPIRAVRRHARISSRWFDDRSTPTVETRDEVMRRALSEALGWLVSRFGSGDMDRWSYGRIHTLRMPHQLGRAQRLRSIVDIGPVEIGGSNTTVNNAEWDFNRPYEIRLGPTMRQIVDFGDTSVFLRSVVTSGTSGQPLSQFYSNQTILWTANGHVRLRDRAPEGTFVSSRTILRPAPRTE
jgi:penicillin amidase